MMKKLVAGWIAAWCLVSGVFANETSMQWDKFPTERMTDLASLQNGAKLFVNYCLNCHGASFARYNRMKDLGLTDEQIRGNLMFAAEKVGETMKVAIDPKHAKEWFGATPPDLSMVARSRAGQGTGADYLYTYLRSYYRDDTKATGWNNLAFPSVAMPNVLWELQGQQRAVFEEVADPHDHEKKIHHFKDFEQVTPGKLSQAEYNQAMADLVAFLQWMGEPAQGQRVRLGVWVLIFLAVFTLFAWRLNAAYWKDVK